jgi:hypothetical protein
LPSPPPHFSLPSGINRERVPFVFTPDLAYVMGGKGEKHYNKFVGMCMSAHQILQKHSALFINLFNMVRIGVVDVAFIFYFLFFLVFGFGFWFWCLLENLFNDFAKS